MLRFFVISSSINLPLSLDTPVLLLLAGLQMRDSYLCKEKDHIR